MTQFEAVIIIKDKEDHCFFYGDEGRKEWPTHIKRSRIHKEIKGFFVDKKILISVREYLEQTCPDLYKELTRI